MRNTCLGVRTADQFSLGATTTSCMTLFATMASLYAGAARLEVRLKTLHSKVFALADYDEPALAKSAVSQRSGRMRTSTLSRYAGSSRVLSM